MTLRGLVKLLEVLGGKVAAAFRALLETTFSRVMAGDLSLIKVIQANAASNEPLQQAFREAMQNDPSPGGILPDDFLDEMVLKRRREKLELDAMEAAIHERQAKTRTLQLENDAKEAALKQHVAGIEAKELSNKNKELELQEKLFTSYAAMCPDGIADERARMQFKECLMHTVAQQMNALPLTEEQRAEAEANKSITVTTVAAGIKEKLDDGEAIRVGVIMVELYKKKYGNRPGKHQQMLRGGVRDVNSYTARDKEMMEQAIRRVVACRGRPLSNFFRPKNDANGSAPDASEGK